MTLPRSKSRPILVEGTTYRWMASRVDHEFSMVLRVEHAEGQGQLLVVEQREVHGTSRLPPITPRYVAAAIRHARLLGWQPESPGRELRIDSTQLGRPPRASTTDAPPAGTTALWSRVDFDPLRLTFPWKHHDPGLFLEFRLAADPSEKAVGSFVAHLARRHGLVGGGRPSLVLEALCRPNPEARAVVDAARPYYLPGGIEVIVEGRFVVAHGCCVTLDEWVQWRELLRSGKSPWNGHDPFTHASLDGDTVTFFEEHRVNGEPASVSRERYAELLAALEGDLRGFLRGVEAWLTERASAEVVHTLMERITPSMGLA
jgi:hypothetical protein